MSLLGDSILGNSSCETDEASFSDSLLLTTNSFYTATLFSPDQATAAAANKKGRVAGVDDDDSSRCSLAYDLELSGWQDLTKKVRSNHF